MTGREASEVVAVLLAGYPKLSLEPEAFRLWTSLISELHDHNTALAVARGMVRNQPEPPTIAGFREQYHAAAARKRDQAARERGIEEARVPGVPVDVRRWMVDNKIGRPM